jgi:hypothetical protein
LEDMTDDEYRLFRACLAWRPGNSRLEDSDDAQAYLRRHPDNIEVVRSLEFLFAVRRGVAGSAGSP